jgi:hypothetical protein
VWMVFLEMGIVSSNLLQALLLVVVLEFGGDWGQGSK